MGRFAPVLLAWLFCGAPAFADSVVFELNGVPRTLSEFAAPESVAQFREIAQIAGIRSAQISPKSAAAAKARPILLTELPAALGKPCAIQATDAEILTYVRWWDKQIEREGAYQLAREAAANQPAPPAGAKPYSAAFIEAKKNDPADANVRKYAAEEIERQKAYACIAAAYPAEPLGANAVLPPAGGAPQQGNFAAPQVQFTGGAGPSFTPIKPIAQCAAVYQAPGGAIWDMFKEAEEKGVLKFVDGDFRREFSSLRQKRPAGRHFQAQPCYDAPPWTKEN